MPFEARNVGEVLIDSLASRGIRRGYTVPGESFMPVLEGFRRHEGLELISVRHESSAAFMAEADGKLTGVPAVAMATRGVGASNLSIGVHTAFQDSTPMIILLGQVETNYLGREAFQELDLPDYFAQITKWGATLHRADRAAELAARAHHIATSGRPGPVVLALPADVLDQPSACSDGWIPGVRDWAGTRLAEAAVENIVQHLMSAIAPALIIGPRAAIARHELVSLAEATGADVYTAFRRGDHFPNAHPRYAGHLTLGTAPAILAGIEAADAVLVLGARLDEVTTQTYRVPNPNAWIAQLDVDPGVVGSQLPVDLGAVVDLRAALKQLADFARTRPISRAHDAHERYLSTLELPSAHPQDAMDPGSVIRTLADVFPPNAILTNDAGNFSVFAHRYWQFEHDRSQLAPVSGAMGYGLPAAIGAAFTGPERPVVALAGDGGFLMTGSELEVAVRHKLDITVIVFANGLYGTIALHQARTYGQLAGVDIGHVDFVQFAEAFGAVGIRATDDRALRNALVRSLQHRGPVLIEVPCDPDLLVPGTRLSDFSK